MPERTEAVLLNPKLPYPTLRAEGLDFYSRIWPPLDLLNALDILSRRGISCRLVDAHAKRMDAGTTARACKNAENVVITTSTLDRWQCPYPKIPHLKELIGEIRNRNPQAEIMLFGAHGTSNPAAAMQAYGADKAIQGDETMILKALRHGGRTAKCAGTDLNAVTPDYSSTDPKDYAYEIFGDRLCLLETSRGCTHNCSFCFKKMHGRYREKTPENTLAELSLTAEKGYTHAYFIDLNFCGNRKKTLELCRLMKRERTDLAWTCQTRADTLDRELLATMRSAGCGLVHLGIETGSDAMLRACGKGTTAEQSKKAVKLCREAGIETAGFFLLGFPGQSREELEGTVEFAERLGLDYASLRAVTPYNKWDAHPYKAAYMDGEHLDALKKTILKAYLRMYLKPASIARVLGKPNAGRMKILKEAVRRGLEKMERN